MIKTLPDPFWAACTEWAHSTAHGLPPWRRAGHDHSSAPSFLKCFCSASAPASTTGCRAAGACTSLPLGLWPPKKLQGSSAAWLTAAETARRVPATCSCSQPSLQRSKEINTHLLTLSEELTRSCVWGFFLYFLTLSAQTPGFCTAFFQELT